jgi:invasion protein IalB
MMSRPILSALIAVLIFAVGIAVGWIGRGAQSSLPDVPTIAFYDGWRLACPASSQKDKPCTISNDLVDSKTQRHVAQLAIVPTKSGTVLAVTAPFDVLLTAGVGVALGADKPRTYPYQTCTEAGCIAEIPMDDALRTAMLRGGQGKLLFGSLDGKTVAVVFSLHGFKRANTILEAHAHGGSLL